MNSKANETPLYCLDCGRALTCPQPDGSDLYTCVCGASDTVNSLKSLAVAMQAMQLQSDASNAALLAYYELEF